MKFDIVSQIEDIEIIAVGTSIRDLAYLQKSYGRGRWRKLKEKPLWNYPMARSGELNCIGMKPMVLVEKI